MPRGPRSFLRLLPRLLAFLRARNRRRRRPLLLEVSLMGVRKKVRGAVLPRLASAGTPAIRQRRRTAQRPRAHGAGTPGPREPASPPACPPAPCRGTQGDPNAAGAGGGERGITGTLPTQHQGKKTHLQGKFEKGTRGRANLRHFFLDDEVGGWGCR